MRVLVSGGCGFIGSALVLHLVEDLGHDVLNVDALTYAANPLSLAGLENNSRHRLVRADICAAPFIKDLVAEFAPHAVMHLAAESHVDRSITGPAAFVRTNVLGTQSMLDATRSYWEGLPPSNKQSFRFCMSQPMKFMDPSAPKERSTKTAATIRDRHILLQRRLPIIWYELGARPMDFRF